MRAVIEFTFHDDMDEEFLQDYMRVLSQMFLMFHFVEGVYKCDIIPEPKEYVVDFNDKYSKIVKANSPEEARRKAVDERQGDTMVFETELISVEERS